MNKILRFFGLKYIILMFLLLNVYLSFKEIILFYLTGFYDINHQLNSLVFAMIAIFVVCVLFDLEKYHYNGGK